MAEKTKITLSDKELELVCNSDFILTKNKVIQKVYALFGEMVVPMKSILLNESSTLPENVNMSYPKISKGENYNGLPYVMLDYPRCFEKENTIAIRTFFWWGNFFSISLQLSGICKTNATAALVNNLSILQEAGYWLCIGKDPWQHHFGDDNYTLLKNYSEAAFSTIITDKTFVKIAKKISLQDWENVPLFLETSFLELIQLVRS